MANTGVVTDFYNLLNDFNDGVNYLVITDCHADRPKPAPIVSTYFLTSSAYAYPDLETRLAFHVLLRLSKHRNTC